MEFPDIPGVIFEEPEVLQRDALNENLFHIVFHVEPPRPGAGWFMTKLEHDYYRPNTAKNDDFILRFIHWEEMIFAIVTIPFAERENAYKVAKATGMRIADGIPMLIDNTCGEPKDAESMLKAAKRFPMSSPRVFSLENDRGSAVYEGITGIKHIMEFEEAHMEKIFADHLKWRKENGFKD